MSFLKPPSISDALRQVPIVGEYILGNWTVRFSKSEKKIADFSAFLGFDYKSESTTPSSVIESGSFVVWNKINNPNEVNVSLVLSGSNWDIQSVLSDLEDARYGTGEAFLIDVVTPHKVFRKNSLNGLNYSIKEGSAVNLLVVELGLKEIKEAIPQYKTSALPYAKQSNPENSSATDTGKQTLKPSLLSNLGSLF